MDYALAAIGALAFAAGLAGAAYTKGMFFDGDLYRWEAIVVALAACVAAGVWLRARRLPPLWSAAPFGLVLAYALSYLAGPASVKGTVDAMLRWSLYGGWMVLAGLFFSKPLRRSAGLAAFHAAGLTVVLGGLAGWYGWLAYPEIVFRSTDAALSATGARLAGFLQYPNAYAAVLGMWALAQWQLLDARSRPAAAFGCAALIPSVTALLLTESRGAILAIAIGGILSWVCRPKGRRGYALAAAGIAIGLAAVAAHASFAAMARGAPAAGVWTLLGAAAAGGTLLWALRPRPGAEGAAGSSDGRRRFSRAAAALTTTRGGAALFAIGLAAAYLLLVGGASGGARVEGHLETASARQLYYADALRMFADRPLFGAGGEAWRMLVGLYQRSPYIGNEVHSGYLEVLIDTGIVGLALLLAMLIGYALKLRRRAGAAWGPAAVLLAHAAVDFDWGYAFVWLLLLYWIALQLSHPQQAGGASGAAAPLAATAAEADDALAREGAEHAAAPAETDDRQQRKRAGEAGEAAADRRSRASRAAGAVPALLLIAVAVATAPVAWGYAAAAHADKAAYAAQSDALRIAYWRKALEANPAWSSARLQLGALLPPKERANLLTVGLRYEPQSAAIQYELGMAYIDLGEVEPAHRYLREAIRLSRFNRDAQDAVIARLMRLSERLDDGGDREGGRAAADAAVGFFERYRDLYARLYAGRTNPWHATALFASAKVNAAKAYGRLGMEDKAVPLLREVVAADDGDWKEEAASLLKTMGVSAEAAVK
ncbi:O-antigen ligase family protein [Cohnella nanjingensis]|nr:O-antigen ligase family protein [Cohnella nanjingensis]